MYLDVYLGTSLITGSLSTARMRSLEIANLAAFGAPQLPCANVLIGNSNAMALHLKRLLPEAV